MSLVRLENISKSYVGKKDVLRNISLEISERSVTAILAPTGSGKTTILRIIAGVERPDSGKIFFGDKDVTLLPPQQRNVAMVFQSFALYPNMTVYENIASPLKLRHLPQKEMDERVKQQADILGIQPLLSKIPHELSGGERQRVAIGRALVKGADVFLMDEPLTNLDYKIRESMRMELTELFSKIEGTIVYATPDPREVLAMATHVAFLQDAGITQCGSTLDVYDNPRNVELGTYFGYPPMNIFEGTVITKSGKQYLQLFREIELDLTPVKDRIPREETLIIGLRPNDFRLDPGSKSSMVSFRPTALFSEVIGSETIVYLKHDGIEFRMLVPEMLKYEGKEVEVSFDPEKLYIFSAESKVLLTKYMKK
jgi:ABC-type sugar transport system ATPase subunit